MVRLCVEAQQKCKKFNIFQLCSVIFPTMITKVQIINLLTLFTYTVKISAFHLERFRNGKTWCGWYKNTKRLLFPTLLSHFSNYDYRSTNYQCIASLYIISENFSFPSLKVKKWRTQLWKVRKSSKCQTFSNSAQSFFQL